MPRRAAASSMFPIGQGRIDVLKSILRFFGVESEPNAVADSVFAIIGEGVFANASKHKVVLDGGASGRIVLKGDFDLDESGAVTDGTISSYTAFVNGERLSKAENFDIDFAELAAGLDGGEEALLLLLSSDRAVGSDDDDVVFCISAKIKAGDGDDFILSDVIDKRIKGEGGDDTIVGGAGDEVLFGGRGRDIFVYRNPTDGVDDIRDFKASKDKIGFNSDDFGDLGVGIEATEFTIGTDATTADQRIIYDDVSGNLFWDEDGSGATAQIQLAHLDAGLALTAANFVVSDFL